MFLTVGVTSDRRHLHSNLPIRATALRRPFSLCPAKITKVAVLERSTVLTPFTQPVNLDCERQLNLLVFLIKTKNLSLTSKNLVKFSYSKGKVSSSPIPAPAPLSLSLKFTCSSSYFAYHHSPCLRLIRFFCGVAVINSAITTAVDKRTQ